MPLRRQEAQPSLITTIAREYGGQGREQGERGCLRHLAIVCYYLIVWRIMCQNISLLLVKERCCIQSGILICSFVRTFLHVQPYASLGGGPAKTGAARLMDTQLSNGSQGIVLREVVQL